MGCFFNWSSLFSNEMKRKDNEPARVFFLRKNLLVGWLPGLHFHLNGVNLKHPLQKQGIRDIFWKICYLCVMGCHSWVVRTLRSTVWPRRHTETFIGNFKLYHSIFYIRPNLIEGHLVHCFFSLLPCRSFTKVDDLFLRNHGECIGVMCSPVVSGI